MSNSDITRVCLELISKGGGITSPELINYLNRDFDPNNRDSAYDAEIFTSVLKGFFYCAADGYAFSDVNSVFNCFNMTIEEMYPEATSPFIKFATSYWTLQFLVRPHNIKLEQWPKKTVSWELLNFLEINIAGLFFPTPGSQTIEPNRREKDQREIIKTSGAPIDIEEFIKHNPILIRDRITRIQESNHELSLSRNSIEDGCKEKIEAAPINQKGQENMAGFQNSDETWLSKLCLSSKRLFICFGAIFILGLYSVIAVDLNVRFYLPIGLLILSLYSWFVVKKFKKIYPVTSRALGQLAITFLLISLGESSQFANYKNSIQQGTMEMSYRTIHQMAMIHVMAGVASMMFMGLLIAYIVSKKKGKSERQFVGKESAPR